MIVTTAMEHAGKILKDKVDILHKLSLELLEREILDAHEIDAIINGEELPPVVKEDVKKEKSKDKNVPDHVKKLMETRKSKETSPKDDNN